MTAMSDGATVDELLARLQRVEDDLAIQRLVLGYGPAADAGLGDLAGSRWLEDGEYDWDGKQSPHQGRDAIQAMLSSKTHLGLIAQGAAHVAGPVLVDVDGDRATALHYSLIMRHEDGRFYVRRVSAARWDLERTGRGWAVHRRTNRLVDDAGEGIELFKVAVR